MRRCFSFAAAEAKGVTDGSGSIVDLNLQTVISSGYSCSSLGSTHPLTALLFPGLTVLGAVRLEETVFGPHGPVWALRKTALPGKSLRQL